MLLLIDDDSWPLAQGAQLKVDVFFESIAEQFANIAAMFALGSIADSMT